MQNNALLIWIESEKPMSLVDLGSLDVHKYVFYPDELITDDCFSYAFYEKELQEGANSCQRMANAMRLMFEYRFDKVLLLTEEGLKLNGSSVLEAYEGLNEVELVISPSGRESFRFIGLKGPLPMLFNEKLWQSPEFILDFILALKENKVDYRIM